MKIDTTTIEGYAEMTPEQKIEALEAFEYADLSGEVERYKNAVTKASSDAAEWKRKYNEKLTDAEKRQQEENQKDELIADLQKQISINENVAKLVALGYSAELAQETAAAIADGNMDVVFANQKKLLEAKEAAVRADLLTGTGKPTGRGEEKQMTKEDVRKMSPAERLHFYQTNPDEYKRIYGGS